MLATGTASGKSLAYLLPALTAVRRERGTGLGARRSTALYLAPTKALAADQLARVESLRLPGVRAATYDGDTAPDERRWIRDHASVVLTNPDLLHHSLLPGHERWARFLRGLERRGHRRVPPLPRSVRRSRGRGGAAAAPGRGALRRVADVRARLGHGVGAGRARRAAHGAGGDARDGRRVAPRSARRRALGAAAAARMAASTTPRPAGEPPPRRPTCWPTSPAPACAAWRSCGRGAAPSTWRRRARTLLAEVDPDLAPRVAAYRGGYLPEERRALERRLRSGDLLAVAATNALELGVDVTGLDAVLLAGWPGRRSSMWQQAGRAGRDGQDALAVLVAADDPLDTYLVTHPDAVFGTAVEATVLDEHNPYVLAPHLAAAAAELPLTDADVALFGAVDPRAARRAGRRGACCAGARPAGTGRAATERRRTSTCAARVARCSRSSRSTAVGCSARWTPRRLTAPCTRAPCTCTRATPTWCAVSTSPGTWRSSSARRRPGRRRPAPSPTSASCRRCSSSSGGR